MRIKNLTTLTLLAIFALTGTSLAELKIRIHSTSASASKVKSKSLIRSADDKSTVRPGNQSSQNDYEYEGPGQGLDRYGKGDTLTSREQHQDRVGVIDRNRSTKSGSTFVRGETRLNETRSRTYEERGLLSYKTGGQAQASLVRSEYHTGYDSPKARVAGMDVAQVRTRSSTEAFVGAQANAEAGYDLNPLDPRLEASAGVFVGARVDHESKAKVEVLGGSASTTARGSASVGVEATANAAVSKEGAEAKVGAFAGARAEGEVGAEVGGVGAEARGEAWAGVGAEADATAKFEDGKLQLGGDVGVGVGVGGKVGTSTTIDVNKVAHDGQAVVKNGSELIRRTKPQLIQPIVLSTDRFVAKTVRMPATQWNTTQTAGSNARTQASKLGRTIQKTTRQSYVPVRTTVSSGKKLANQVHRDFRRLSQNSSAGVSRSAKSVSSKVNSGLAKSGRSASKAVTSSAEKVSKTVKRTSKKAKSGLKKIGKKIGF